MKRQNGKRQTAKTAIVGLIAGAMMTAGVGIANAYPGTDYNEDSSFLASLREVGIRYNNPSKPVELAKSICAARKAHITGNDLLDTMSKDLSGVMTSYQIGYFYGSSIRFYCPEVGYELTTK